MLKKLLKISLGEKSAYGDFSHTPPKPNGSIVAAKRLTFRLCFGRPQASRADR